MDELLKTQQEWMKAQTELIKYQTEQLKLQQQNQINHTEVVRTDGIKWQYILQIWVSSIIGVGAVVSLIIVLAKG